MILKVDVGSVYPAMKIESKAPNVLICVCIVYTGSQESGTLPLIFQKSFDLIRGEFKGKIPNLLKFFPEAPLMLFFRG